MGKPRPARSSRSQPDWWFPRYSGPQPFYMKITVEREVAEQFQKKFHFRPATDDGGAKPPELPPLDSVFSTRPAYQVESLQQVKAALNKVKNRLNDFEISDWHQHTRRRSSLQPILTALKHRIGAEFVTQAFAKLYECVAEYELVPPASASREFYSVHLCEAPGAFITGLNHYLKLNRETVQWRWFANTLNPYYEGNGLGNMIVDDRFILHTLDSWCFGEDHTGDVMRKENMREIVRRSKEFPMINLVTADGSIDCLDVPEAQEEHVSKLHLAEALNALKMLTKDGCFILKMFTLFEHSSVDLLYLLYVCFQELHVFKPATSKPGNSEVYVIAKYFRKPDGLDAYLDRLFDCLHSDGCSMFDLKHIPEAFVGQVRDCAEQFMLYQQDVIEHNVHYYEKHNPDEEVRLRLFKEKMCKQFFDKYLIKPIRKSDAILNGVDVASSAPNINPRDNYGTYNERSMLNSISGDTRLDMLRDRLDELYDNMIRFMPRSKLSDRPLASSRSSVEIIQLCCGKSIQKVLSSKFIVVTYVRFLSDVIDAVTSSKPTDAEPSTLLTLDRSTYTLTIDIKAYATVSNYDIFEKELFHHLLQCIVDLPLQEGIDHLVIENWLLLTQFCVGLVFFLKTYVFERTDSSVSGNQLRFSCLKPDGIDSLRYLNEAIQMEQNGCAEGKSVLGIVPTQVLFDGTFYYAVINYNNQLCLDYCTVLLDAGKPAN